MRLGGVILAGGLGRRMGGVDKALLRLADQRLIDRVAARLAPQVTRMALSANGDATRFADLSLPVLPDIGPSQGPLSGIAAGLAWARGQGLDAILSCPVDLPFLPLDLARRLTAAATAADPGADLGAAGPAGRPAPPGAIRPAYARAQGRDHPATALWPLDLAEALERFLASGAPPRIRDFLLAEGARATEFADAGAFANLNHPADLSAAQARLAAPDPAPRPGSSGRPG